MGTGGEEACSSNWCCGTVMTGEDSKADSGRKPHFTTFPVAMGKGTQGFGGFTMRTKKRPSICIGKGVFNGIHGWQKGYVLSMIFSEIAHLCHLRTLQM